MAELKCELEFQGYRYLRLVSSSQLKHHTGRAFTRFLDLAKNPDRYTATVNGKVIPIVGAILIWGSITPQGRASVISDKGLAEVLSLEEITNDLLNRGNGTYTDLIQHRVNWCQHLFSGLASKPCTE